MPTKVVFACVQNAGRSQMAAAFFNALADPALAHAVSAGTRPASRVHEMVAAAMREAGLPLEGSRPQGLTPELTAGAAWIITMGCGDDCPVVPGARHEDWALADPAGQPLERVRAIRDEIRQLVEHFVAREAYGR